MRSTGLLQPKANHRHPIGEQVPMKNGLWSTAMVKLQTHIPYCKKSAILEGLPELR